MQILGRNGYISGRAEAAFLPDNLLKAISPDVVVFQRQYEDGAMKQISRYRETLLDAHFVFELDDILSAVPEDSWHAPFMPPNVDARVAAAIALFDTVTTSTQDLASHLASICAPGTRIRVVPNMLGRDDLETGEQIRKSSPIQPTPGKLRIGWGGGVGHVGNLQLLHDAMQTFKNHAEWVFIGMDPATPPGVHKTFAGAATPERYIASLAALNVDLIVAPLHDNIFNRCKSNLRLLEAGVCSYPVIASPITPYLTDDPPVSGYAETPADWIAQIEAFLALTPTQRAERGTRMRQWVASRYILDDPKHCERRTLAWLPEHSRVFTPKLNHRGFGLRVVHDKPIGSLSAESDLLTALTDSDSDVLYVRPGAHITERQVNRMTAMEGDVVCALTNDGGPWGFPSQQQFTPLDPIAMTGIASVCDGLPEIEPPIEIAGCSGPAVLLRRRALSAIGIPDLANLSPEVAILEWSVAARSRGLKLAVCHNAFIGVDTPQPPAPGEAELATMRIQNRWPAGNNNEAALKALRETIELRFHHKNFAGLPPANRQDYATWASQCDTAGPRTLDSMTQWLEGRGDIIKLLPLRYGQRLPSCDEINAHDWLLFCGKETQLTLDAKAQLLKAIGSNPTASIIYADHDHSKFDGSRFAPDFKPAFDLHMLLSRDYVTQIVAIRNDTFWEAVPADALGAEHVQEVDVYEAVLCTVGRRGREAVAHLPHVIAHLPTPQMDELARTANEKALIARKFTDAQKWNVTIDPNPALPSLRTISYAPAALAADQPPVTIIIPTRNNLDMLAPCVATILKMTQYANYNVLIVDNGSDREDMLAHLAALSLEPRIEVLRYDVPFNWAHINNFAVDFCSKHDQLAATRFFVFLNDDTRVLAHEWLQEMVGAALTPNAGAIGAHLNYPHGLIQHIGVYATDGLAGHPHKGLPVGHPGNNGICMISHESTAVTGACMLISKANFALAGGFDERLPNNFNDVAFCRKLRSLGLLSIVANKAELQHYEGVTRSPTFDETAARNLREDGANLMRLYPEIDPYWNPNLEVQAIQNGVAIGGMNCDVYRWPPPEPAWPLPDRERILLTGPLGAAMDELRDRAAIFQTEIFGNVMRIANPPMSNCGPWDVRIASIAKAALTELGIDRILLTGLGEAPLHFLAFLTALDIPITYRPLDAEAACPRGNLKSGEESCNRGFLRSGACQTCLAAHSSAHGSLLIDTWRAEWMRFLQAPQVTADLSAVQDPDYIAAISAIFAEQDMLEAAE